MNGTSYRERTYEAESKKFQVAEFDSGKLASHIIGKMDNTALIMFRRSDRRDILRPQEPPIWFPKDNQKD